MLQELYRVKELREDSALTEMRRRDYQLQECIRRRDQHARELSEYRHWRLAREDELFAALQDRQVVLLKDIEDYKTAVALLRERENLLHEQLNAGERELAAARSALAQAQQAHAAAAKRKEQFAQYLDSWRAEMRRERERQEDLELEEFGAKPVLITDKEGLHDD